MVLLGWGLLRFLRESDGTQGQDGTHVSSIPEVTRDVKEEPPERIELGQQEGPPRAEPEQAAIAKPVTWATPEDAAAELFSLAMRNDREALERILIELTNSDRRIRKIALEAVIQFGDRSATDYLRELAQRTEDPEEKAALEEAIEYLMLPSLTEVLSQRQGNVKLGELFRAHPSPGLTNQVPRRERIRRSAGSLGPRQVSVPDRFGPVTPPAEQ
ncbi:MAG: HEAT repeat domain-containing protein [Verrucomicrobiae bacterium]|nr:HEAT repeat domain-containing protein [Verrucomicrobiae bacterium]